MLVIVDVLVVDYCSFFKCFVFNYAATAYELRKNVFTTIYSTTTKLNLKAVCYNCSRWKKT